MYLRLMSDLHLEFNHTPKIPKFEEDFSYTTLILAGDIGVGTSACEWIEKIASQFKAVIYIMGNHEYYHNSLGVVPDQVKKELKHIHNVYVLDNESVTINEVLFIGSTLWTDFDKNNPMVKLKAQASMSDYKYIRNPKFCRNIIPPDIYEEHKYSLGYLQERLKNSHKDPKVRKVVVITHHAPLYYCVHPKYRSSSLNPMYASDLGYLIEEWKPAYWFFGHTHRTKNCHFNQFTHVMNNPYGYHEQEVNPEFDPKFRVEV